MQEVWNYGGILYPVFLLMAYLDILFPEQGTNVKCELRVVNLVDGGQHWGRSFSFKNIRRFDARMTVDKRSNMPLELLGKGELIGVTWRMKFLEPDILNIISEDFFINIFGLRLYLPRFAKPRVEARQEFLGNELVRVSFKIFWLWFGPIFAFNGDMKFQLREKS